MKKILSKIFTLKAMALLFTVGEILIEMHPHTQFKPLFKIVQALGGHLLGL